MNRIALMTTLALVAGNQAVQAADATVGMNFGTRTAQTVIESVELGAAPIWQRIELGQALRLEQLVTERLESVVAEPITLATSAAATASGNVIFEALIEMRREILRDISDQNMAAMQSQGDATLRALSFSLCIAPTGKDTDITL